MKAKAYALVLKAVAYQAADSVRWSRTFLADLWESEHLMRDEDSCSSNESTLSYSNFGTLATYISSLTGNNKKVACSKSITKSKKPFKYDSRSRFSVPSNIITRKNAKMQKNGSDGDNGWQQSVVFQILAFFVLFGLCVKFMALKEFCHAFLQHDFHFSFLTTHGPALRGGLFNARSPKGISFHRVIGKFPEDSQFLLQLEENSTHCQVYDDFGVNDCHFNWKEEAVGNFSTAISTVLDESSFVEAHLVLEGHIPYKLSCALCGQPCEVGLPVIDFKYTFRMPDCPVDLRNHFQDFQYQLWSHSPTEGMVSISLEATATVYSAPGVQLAEFEVKGTIR
jgi:hypothetical protein